MTVKEFWECDERLCIHCNTKEKTEKLLKKFYELGKKWKNGMSYLAISDHNTYYKEQTAFLNDGLLCSLDYAKIKNIEIIEFDELDDFKENHEKDVFDYMNKSFDSCKLDAKILKMGTFKLDNLSGTMFVLKNVTKDMLIVNKEKKYVLLKLDGKEYKVECHKDDKFDWLIGFGLALSKYYGNWNKSKNAREYFRNPKTHKLNYKEYAKWCVCDFFMNDTTKISKLQDKVKEINEYGKVDL